MSYPRRLLCGIDDGGSGEMAALGYVAVDEAVSESMGLSTTAARLRKQLKIREFHGKQLRNPRASREFLEAIRKCLRLGGTGGGFELIDRAQFHRFEDRAAELVEQVAATRGHPGSELLDWTRERCAPVLWICAKLEGLPSPSRLRLIFDSTRKDDVTLQDAPLFMTGSANQIRSSMRAREVLRILGGIHLDFLIKEGKAPPGMEIEAVSFVRSEHHDLVQAADLVVNFGLSYVKSQIRVSGGSKKEREKAKLFEDNFTQAEAMTGRDVGSWRERLAIDRNNELALVRPPPVTFSFRCR